MVVHPQGHPLPPEWLPDLSGRITPEQVTTSVVSALGTPATSDRVFEVQRSHSGPHLRRFRVITLGRYTTPDPGPLSLTVLTIPGTGTCVMSNRPLLLLFLLVIIYLLVFSFLLSSVTPSLSLVVTTLSEVVPVRNLETLPSLGNSRQLSLNTREGVLLVFLLCFVRLLYVGLFLLCKNSKLNLCRVFSGRFSTEKKKKNSASRTR